MALKTDYKDDVLDTTVNEKRVYNLVDQSGNTVMSGLSLEDVTVYSQTGDSFGAQEINEINNDLTVASEQSAINKQTLGYSKKNLLKCTATSQTVNGVTFTVNDDGSVTVNGTATAKILKTIYRDKYFGYGSFHLSGSLTDIRVKVQKYINGAWSKDYRVGDGEFAIPKEDTEDNTCLLNVVIEVPNGTIVNQETVYPMIRDARITDPTYEPYVDDVDTRIAKINSDLEEQVLTFTNKTVATSAWSESGNEDFPYYVDVTCSGVTTSHVPNVNFSLADANSGIFSTVAETVSGAVRIYASEKPTATLTIPTIQCIKSV